MYVCMYVCMYVYNLFSSGTSNPNDGHHKDSIPFLSSLNKEKEINEVHVK